MTEHERVDPDEVTEALGAEPVGEGATALDWLCHQYPWLKTLIAEKDEMIADMTRAVLSEDRLIKELAELEERYKRQQQELMTAHSDYASLNSRHMDLVAKHRSYMMEDNPKSKEIDHE